MAHGLKLHAAFGATGAILLSALFQHPRVTLAAEPDASRCPQELQLLATVLKDGAVASARPGLEALNLIAQCKAVRDLISATLSGLPGATAEAAKRQSDRGADGKSRLPDGQVPRTASDGRRDTSESGTNTPKLGATAAKPDERDKKAIVEKRKTGRDAANLKKPSVKRIARSPERPKSAADSVTPTASPKEEDGSTLSATGRICSWVAAGRTCGWRD